MCLPRRCETTKETHHELALDLFARYPQLGRKYWGRHLWARGYCVSTVGIDEEMIRQYVRWQEKQEREDDSSKKTVDVATDAPSRCNSPQATASGGGN